MKLYIGVTDNDWFRFLRSQAGVEEVNFWQPGGKATFKALQPGGLFLFKLHYPENFIAGSSFFVHSTLLSTAFRGAKGPQLPDQLHPSLRS